VSHHRELINPPDLHPAPGFSHIAVAHGDRVVYFAGQLGIGQDFSLAAENLYGQTAAAMRNLKTAMEAAGVTWGDVVRRTIYTTEPTDYETITRAIDDVTLGAEHPPQTIVGITGLAVPGCLIEIECTAVVSDQE
jgi:enamine deaminase RidA (YjgF/YER057c/UK114 family)